MVSLALLGIGALGMRLRPPEFRGSEKLKISTLFVLIYNSM
jgi:hypothetical protein